MLFTIARLFVIAGCLFAVIYGIIRIAQGGARKYFCVAFAGMLALFLCRLYFFIFSISNGDDTLFSVGVFGQIAAYMFFSLANRSFISGHGNTRDKFQPAAFVLAAIPGLIYLVIGLLSKSFIGMFCEVLYVLCLASAVYFAFAVAQRGKTNANCKALAPFNICVCILVYANALQEIINLFSGPWIQYISIVLALIIGIVIGVMLPILNRGTEKWGADK